MYLTSDSILTCQFNTIEQFNQPRSEKCFCKRPFLPDGQSSNVLSRFGFSGKACLYLLSKTHPCSYFCSLSTGAAVTLLDNPADPAGLSPDEPSEFSDC